MDRPTILVVEDNADILDAVRLLVEQAGFRVITAQDCFTAFDLLSHHPTSLIVTDLLIPEMTGLEFIRWVRRTTDFDRVPILAMSAYDERYLVAAVMAGADAAIHKPEGLDELVPTIESLLKDNYPHELARVS